VLVEAAAQGLWTAPGAPAWAPVETALAALVLVGFGLVVGRGRFGAASVAAALVALAGGHASAAGAPDGWPVAVGIVGVVALVAPRVGLVLAVGAAAWAPALRVRPEPFEVGVRDLSRDVVLVTIDTLRDDAGLDPGDGPWWRAVGVSAAPWTLPGMDSLMLGAPVRAHGGGLYVDGAHTRPDARFTPVAERLRAAGYQTVALASNPHLRAEMGFDRGFVSFDHADDWLEPHALVAAADRARRVIVPGPTRLSAARDARLLDRGREVLATAGPEPLFLWIHLMLPHEYTRAAVAPPPGWSPGTEDPVAKRAAYAGNVDAVGRLIAGFAGAVAPDALLVVTSDHGESLGEAGIWGHGRTLCDEQLLVPVFVRGRGPGGAASPVPLTALADLLVEGPLPEGADVVDVGGVRRDAAAFASRRADGTYLPATPPERFGAPRAPDPDLREALEALGYTQ
jgi:hypothetical protein